MPKSRRTIESWSAGWWLIFSLYVSWQSLRLGIGRPGDPRPGFIFFWSALVLAGLAVLLVRRSRVEHRDREASARPTNWTKIVVAVFVLILYSLLLERIGFLVTTVLMTAAIVRLAGENRWSRIVTFAIGVTLATYVILQVWLQTRLPPGVLG